MGELAVSTDPAIPLAIHGLGSCVGVSLWDPKTRVAALAHFMLPAGANPTTPAKFVDGGVANLVAAFEAAGGSRRRAQVKAVGGAAVLAFSGGGGDIGRRNGEAVERCLRAAGLGLTASDLGGTTARTIELSVQTGTLSVRSAAATRQL